MSKLTKLIKIKKFIFVNNLELEQLEEDQVFLGIILCISNPIFTKKEKSSKKIYLNSTGILLKNNKYFNIIKTNETVNNDLIIKKTNELYGYQKDDILTIINLFNNKKLKYYLVRINKQLKIKDYNWTNRLEMFRLNPEDEFDDIYENILNYSKNFKFDIKLMPDKYLSSFIKLEKIYKSLIGEDIINHADALKELSNSSKS